MQPLPSLPKQLQWRTQQRQTMQKKEESSSQQTEKATVMDIVSKYQEWINITLVILD